jgi:hypothetical protein
MCLSLVTGRANEDHPDAYNSFTFVGCRTKLKHEVGFDMLTNDQHGHVSCRYFSTPTAAWTLMLAVVIEVGCYLYIPETRMCPNIPEHSIGTQSLARLFFLPANS